jgi:hypothetical protein
MGEVRPKKHPVAWRTARSADGRARLRHQRPGRCGAVMRATNPERVPQTRTRTCGLLSSSSSPSSLLRRPLSQYFGLLFDPLYILRAPLVWPRAAGPKTLVRPGRDVGVRARGRFGRAGGPGVGSPSPTSRVGAAGPSGARPPSFPRRPLGWPALGSAVVLSLSLALSGLGSIAWRLAVETSCSFFL